MISEVNCGCGVVLDNEQEVEWHRTTEGHLWSILKKELDGNYVSKKKIPEDAKCDICNEAQTKRKRAPKWFIVSGRDKLTVRCKKCKKDRLDLIKSQFRELLSKRQ